MNYIFHTIGIIGYSRHLNNTITHKTLYYWLKKRKINVIMEKQTASFFKIKTAKIANLIEIGQKADLAIIIGGDGNMLRAANILSHYDIKIIGINHGNLGFLTDLEPNSALKELSNILKGNFLSEKRFLLEIKIYQHNIYRKTIFAINEVILHSKKISHMITFEIYINNNFTFTQHSDGLIIATPTGSTAYSLSAGGPIVTPEVNAIILLPVLPHNLSSRPIIINSNNIITLKFPQLTTNLKINCDNQTPVTIKNKSKIHIQRSSHYLNLIHPNTYNYFKTLKTKLGWAKSIY
ncbi:NAD(+) kinase [Blochmannia endosymbiont of Camponotus (Colobopsis) obliquus]|uniref:NAD(+) kinase n=1 Tax=Blochmannia endosymbiont of Camponotus (Colobopsis) obliquus TaxID=1505597 RepID=UPI00061A5ADD|nr:NAD(+) kinase [Blochmannia endosymbiont of Camponotus (Colobopsis) obliquus]AKC60694.1 putative inorganic polyphosphate/ATP-NAD kinase [Blochmannia endosymbiont of Camponotus (Colobopsis) obliquus]